MEFVCPAGSRSAPATSSRAAAAATAVCVSTCVIWSSRTAGMSTCRPTRRRTGRERAAAVGIAGPGHENNFCRSRNRQRAWALTIDAGWSAPQPPTPHPSGDRPWPLRAPGSSFCGKPPPRWNPSPAARLDVPARSNPHVGCRRRVGGPVLKGDTRRPFFIRRGRIALAANRKHRFAAKNATTHFESIGLK
jgi:hypothetical protein